VPENPDLAPRGGVVDGALLQMQPHTYKNFLTENQVQVEHTPPPPTTYSANLSPKKISNKIPTTYT
jgi:hypothetical protein